LIARAALLAAAAAAILAIAAARAGPDTHRWSLDLGRLSGPGWQADDVHLAVRFGRGERADLSLSAHRLHLPGLGELRDARLSCAGATLGDRRIACPHGTLELHGARLDRPTARASFAYRPGDGRLSVTVRDLAVAGGRVGLAAEYAGNDWQAQVVTRQVDAARLAGLLEDTPWWPHGLNASAGRLDLQATLAGRLHRGELTYRRASLRGHIDKLAFSNADGTDAGEDLDLDLDTRVHRAGTVWRLDGSLAARGGTLCIDTCWTLPAAKTAVQLSARLTPDANDLNVQRLHLSQDADGGRALQATASLRLRLGRRPALQAAHVRLAPSALDALYSTWLQPLLIGTAFDALDTDGQIQGRIDYTAGGAQRVDLRTLDVNVDDRNRRFGLYGVNARLHWRSGEHAPDSQLRWDGGHLYRVRLGPAELALAAHGRDLRLLRAAHLAILDGALDVDRFRLSAIGTAHPGSRFDAVLTPVSMAALTHALGWPIMSGQLSGVIPSVTYDDGALRVGGVLLVRAFDGSLTLRGLRLEHLFGAVPQLYANVDLNDLDLASVTRTFSFGEIQGRLGGYVRELHMVDWKPVAFDARLATPPGDDSRHRISQKAVDNLTNLGGGGITGALSRSLLGMFKTFSYDRLGLSCRLHDGICDMDGIAPAPQGYYIVRGGGLPRIDIIGYAHEVDWHELVARLASITASTEPVVQ